MTSSLDVNQTRNNPKSKGANENDCRKIFAINCRSGCVSQLVAGLLLPSLLVFPDRICLLEFDAIGLYELVPDDDDPTAVRSQR